MLTSLSQIDIGQPWPTESEIERLRRYEANKNLFEGYHDLVFGDWVKRLYRDEYNTAVFIVTNWAKRLSTLFADLLLGERPRITAGEQKSKEQTQLENTINDNDFLNVAYEVALDISRYGTGIFKVRYDKRPIIEAVPPSLWFPVVSPDNIKDVQSHVIAWTFETTEKTLLSQRKKTFLRVEIHEKGKITNKLFELDNGVIKSQLPLETFYPDLPEEQETGIDDFLVIPVHNLMTSDRAYGLDDYRDLDSIIQELEIRLSQISRILDKHADPNMYGPDTALEQDEYGNWYIKGGGKYFPINSGDEPPGYVTWDGQLESAFKHIEQLLEQFYALSETSAAAFGQLKSGLAESGTALRRLMMAPLAKVNRTRMRLDPAIKKVLMIASQLDAKYGKGVILENINIMWKDGLPNDEKEQTEIYSTLIQNGLISRETALKHLFEFDSETLREELSKIAVEANQETPALFKANIQTESQLGGEE